MCLQNHFSVLKMFPYSLPPSSSFLAPFFLLIFLTVSRKREVMKLPVKSTDFSHIGLNLSLDSATYSVRDLGQVTKFLWASVSPSV